MFKKHPITALLLILLMSALACNFPTRANVGAPTPTGPDATFTAIAQTLEVILTETAAVTPQVSETANPTQTSLAATAPPTQTLQPLPSRTPAPPTQVPCDLAQFVADLSIPDDTVFAPGQPFTKSWRLKNTGSCTWNTSYVAVFQSGDQMSAPVSVNLPYNVGPGQTVDISVNMTSPSANGTYKGLWKLRSASGYTFGVGTGGSSAFWVQIKVVVGTITPTFTPTVSGPVQVYNFYDRTCDAAWVSQAGVLPCPGANTDNAGFVVKLDNPKLESGNNPGKGVIETHPMWESHAQWNGNGWIQGSYPAVNIKAGYRLKTQIGCLDGASSCDVRFYIKYTADGGAWTSLSPATGWNETYDASLREIDLDLTFLSGKTVEFLFQVDANSNAGQDWAVWVNPRIEK